MTDAKELRALLERADAGPFAVRGRHEQCIAIASDDPPENWLSVAECWIRGDGKHRTNAALITAALNALPSLLDTLTALAGEVDRLKNEAEEARVDMKFVSEAYSRAELACEAAEARAEGLAADMKRIWKIVQRDVHDEDAESIGRICEAHFAHASDCATHNEPALPRGSCDCRTLTGDNA